MTPAPWTVTDSGLTLWVRLTPRGGRDALDGIGEAGGRAVLRLRVAAAPVDGAANDAACKLVARITGLPAGAVRIESGETARVKRLSLAGDGEELARRLALVTTG